MESEINMRQSIKRKRDYFGPLTIKSDETFLDILIGVLDYKRCKDHDEEFRSYLLKQTMDKMEDDLKEKFPHLKCKEYIEWVKERLRTKYEIVSDMRNQGFGWDDEKKMIKVDSVEVWKEYVTRNPAALFYRNTPFPLFDKLARVFGKGHASSKELANSSVNVGVIDKQEEEQNGHASGKEPATNPSANDEMIDKQEEEQNDSACGKESAHTSVNVEMIDDKQEEEQNDPSSGKEPANRSANVELIDKQEEEQSDTATGKEPASPSVSIEMIDKQKEQNDPTRGKEPANPSANVEMIDKQEEAQRYNEENEVEIMLLTPRKHGCMEGPSKKRKREENATADSIFEFKKTIEGLLEKQIEQLGAVVNPLGVDKDIYDDSRKVMNELTKMGLTEQQYFTAADRILSVPHRLHIFWGCNDVNRLAFVKWLIKHS